MGCDNVLFDEWLDAAGVAGFDGDVLVLIGRDGAEVGRFTWLAG